MTTPAAPGPQGYGDTPPDHGSELHALQDHFAELDIVTIGEELGRMDRVERASAFRLLPKDRALDVFEDLDVPLQHEQIGRASCRERGEMQRVGGARKEEREGESW